MEASNSGIPTRASSALPPIATAVSPFTGLLTKASTSMLATAVSGSTSPMRQAGLTSLLQNRAPVAQVAHQQRLALQVTPRPLECLDPLKTRMTAGVVTTGIHPAATSESGCSE